MLERQVPSADWAGSLAPDPLFLGMSQAGTGFQRSETPNLIPFAFANVTAAETKLGPLTEV